MIKFDKVSKIYTGNTYALKTTTLEIERGEFVFLVGVSGAGKSTMIKLLLKEEEPTSGTIYVNKENINLLKRKQIPYFRRKIGVVFQDFRLIPTLNVYENVAFALRATEAPYKDIAKKVPLVLSLMGLSAKHKSFPDELSGGEQQRVAIGRAIINNPLVVIADEPTGNLDPETSQGIMDILNDINRAGTTVIMATHAKDIVNIMKKRVITLESGEVVRDIRGGGYEDEVKFF